MPTVIDKINVYVGLHSIFHRSGYGYSVTFVITDGQGVLTGYIQLNCLIDTPAGTLNRVEQAIRSKKPEINTGGFRRIGTVVLYGIALFRRKRLCNEDNLVCRKLVI